MLAITELVARESTSTTGMEQALARIALLEEALLAEREARRQVEAERDRMRAAYRELSIAMELLRRRIFAAKAERIDTAQLELELEHKSKELDALVGELDGGAPEPPPPPKEKTRRKPTGRRDLSKSDLPEERVEVTDPEMERLVAEGKAERFGFDVESSAVKWRRGGAVRLTIARAKYRLGTLEGVEDAASAAATVADAETTVADAETPIVHDVLDESGSTVTTKASEAASASDASAALVPPPRIDRRFGTTLVTATMPPCIIRRSIGTPSLYAKLVMSKLGRGMPFFRQEDELAHDGFPLDRGTMSRWAHDLGVTAGRTVVAAMRAEALATAFCLATDATGVMVQPIRTHERKRQACKSGHFFVVIADRDHVWFEYTPRETSKAVHSMFRGFSGYVQSDAKSVYDVLFRDLEAEPPDDDEIVPDRATRAEVGCWFHCRRKFYDAAITTKDPVAREALLRIHRLFEYEERWRSLAPAQRKAMRDRVSRAELESFFTWVEVEYRKVVDQRGLRRTALGYARNQKDALLRYLEDGRLQMENNRSERELKRIAVGRKAWLFIGSDDHGPPTAALFSLIASAKLHRLDVEDYLRDLFRVLPHWPEDRYIELAPKYWLDTRARLVPRELAAELGWLTIPPKEQPPSS